MSNISSITSNTAGVASNDVTTAAGRVQNEDGSGTTASGLAVGLAVGGVILAAVLVFIVAYCFFRRRKDNETDSENNNVQRISMNNENFSHVTNLKKLEPLEVKNGKAIPKRTKPTLDEKREVGKADDLSDVDLSLFSGEGQLNPAFIDDDELETATRKTSSNGKDNNMVVFKLEGVVKFDVSQITGVDRNLKLSPDNQTGSAASNTVTSNGDISGKPERNSNATKQHHKVPDKQDMQNVQLRTVILDNKATVSNDSQSKRTTKVNDYKTAVYNADNRQLLDQSRSDMADDIRPGTSSSTFPTAVTARVDGEEVIEVISEGPSTSKGMDTQTVVTGVRTDQLTLNSNQMQQDKPESVAVVIEDRYVPDSDKTKDEKSGTVPDRGFSVIEKTIELDEEYKRKHSVRGREITTIYIGEENTHVGKDKRGRHDRIAFKTDSKSERSGKSEHRKRHLENDPPLKGKDMNVPVKLESIETGKVKKYRHSSDKLERQDSKSLVKSNKKKGKIVPVKPALKREASTYEIPWDMTDVGALLMQVNNIAESD
ncbi:uncharacterized protein [Argopecten irradians]|uniref:uncharacterized protein n=1 Tax=Argopecten irradians TaxID=31199 RepID=UPI00371A2016